MFLVLVGSMFGAQMLMLMFDDPTIGLLIGTLALMTVYMGWLLSIAVKANQKLEEPLKKSPRWMVLGLVYAASYLIGALVLLPGSLEQARGVPGYIVPLHLLAMAAIFYALLFTGKSLVTLERNQASTFFEYSGPFFLLWFFPIGVWFVQPRVVKLLGSGN
jgi:hypothetical protein